MRDFLGRSLRQGAIAQGDLWSGGGRAYRAWMRSGPGGNPRGARIPWRVLAVMAAGPAACAVAVPLLWASSWDGCVALETALLNRSRYAVVGAKHQERWLAPAADRQRRSASQGAVGRRIAQIEYPATPERLSCTLLFWQVRFGM